MVRFVVGDLLTGDRIQIVPVVSGAWSDVLNRAGDIQCTVTLRDPAVRRLRLAQSAAVGKAFLAAIDGDTVLQAGPVWRHSFAGNDEHLTLIGAGMWSYFDHRVLLPTGDTNPTDAATDTRYSAIVSDPDAPGYPWVSDTRKSFQGIARAYVAQAQAWPSGNVPVNLPSEIAGTDERWEKGSNLAFVGPRLTELTNLLDGPDIRFAPKLSSDRQSVEWDMLIGTPTQPQLYSSLDVVFNVGVDQSSVSNLRYEVDGTRMATRAYASGGRGTDTTLISVSSDTTLTSAGYPVLNTVDSSHSTVSEAATLDGYAMEATLAGRTPVVSMAFDHDLTQRPGLAAFNVGDFASVRVKNNSYIETGTYRMRITSRSGDAVGKKVHIEMQPEAD